MVKQTEQIKEKIFAHERKMKIVQEALDRELELKKFVLELRAAQPDQLIKKQITESKNGS